MAEKHGLSKTRLYMIYSGMKQRCYNPKDQHYKWYGARGIKICEEWMGDGGFQNFAEWALSHGYNGNLTIDRENGDKGYEPGNCRWLTVAENTKNKRNRVPTEAEATIITSIRRLIEEHGISWSSIGEILGLSSEALNEQIYNASFSVSDYDRICTALACQPGDIMEHMPDEVSPQAKSLDNITNKE